MPGVMYEVRDKVREEWLKGLDTDCSEDELREAFNAGWKARKTAEYEAIVSVGRDD